MAVVTGSNRGIGLALVKELAKELGTSDTVYLTSRHLARGQEVLEKLQQELGEEGARLRLLQLDVTDQESVENLASHIKREHGGLDVLVNNAGMAFTNDSKVTFSEQARCTVDTNFHGTRRVSSFSSLLLLAQVSAALFPLLRPGARVVAVSSNCGHLSKIGGAEPQASQLRTRLSCPHLEEQQLVEMMEQFVGLAGRGQHVAAGWPDSAYKVGSTH